jgi:hypothetical protein
MNHESDMSLESDLRVLLPETLSDEAAFAFVEALCHGRRVGKHLFRTDHAPCRQS